jgi:O-antigen/teichoic acid export membrane protein
MKFNWTAHSWSAGPHLRRRHERATNDLKGQAVRGGFAKVCAQAANFLIRIGSVMALGRLLEPKDFGLVGMVTAVIGVLNLFRDFGLSTATVQRTSLTDEQISALFWINMLVGAALGLLTLVTAPLVAGFYHEPRLVRVTAALAAGFIFNAAGVQHGALLQRQMRFTALAIIDIVSLLAGTIVGISMALMGYGYWALVGMALISPVVSSAGVWLAMAWIPGKPQKQAEIRSLIRFGGILTLNGLVVYIAYNLEKVLLGRFWGAAPLGVYGRAYQLVNIPTENLNSAAGVVAFAALSRLQNDPNRLKSYFLKAYSLVLALTVPITIVFALFADDLIFVLLGPKWKDAAPIFRLLAPTTLIFAMINPLWWLHYSIGMVGRSLKVASVISALVVVGYLIGLPYGPKGVAFAYSAVLSLWAIPHLAWCVRGTMISLKDILMAVSRPLFSSVVAGALAFCVQYSYGPSLSPLSRLLLGGLIVMGAYLVMLFYVMGQKQFYVDLLQALRQRSSVPENSLVTA